jgi:competence protein ComFC
LTCGKPSYNGLTHPGCVRKYSIEGSFTALVYGPVVKKLIFQFKYKPHLTGLKAFLGDLFYESLIQYEEFEKAIEKFEKEIILVPIPLSSKKFRKRGYNQAEILAKELGNKLEVNVVNGLERVKDTKTQVGLNKKERQENIRGAFVVKKNSANFKDKRVILVDDVLTTGSTFSEAAKVLKQSGVRQVWAVALAKED